jgi:adenine-specific DNA-methyltransferase
VANVIWQKRTSPDARIHLGPAHDYISVFAKDARKATFNKITLTSDQAKNFKNPDNDPRGPWVSTDFSAQGWRPNQMYRLHTPGGAEYEPPPGRCWVNIES